MTQPCSPHTSDCSLLPFNRAALETDFTLKTPTDDPGGSGYWVLLQGLKIVLVNTEAATLPDDLQAAELTGQQPGLYIGDWQGQACRLLAISHKTEIPQSLHAVSILDNASRLPLPLLSLAGLGNAILHWEKNSRFCASCGHQTMQLKKEWGKECPECNILRYPPISPCIIVLVRRNNELLLVRKPEWPDGRFGLVAGFVEFGENLEQTVVRELFEETGISVTNIYYQGSQSWPFPGQLMVGFSADYVEGEIQLQRDELAEGNWFSMTDLPQLPPRRSIARWLIDSALNDLQKPGNMIDD